MGAFESSQLFPVTVSDLGPVAQDVMQYFQSQDYQVSGRQNDARGWLVSVHKGGAFKQVMGMRTALNIKIEPTGAGTMATAGVGIFGQQVIPTMLTLFVAWPVLLPQIWGMVQQSNLDEEALQCVQQSLIAHSGTELDTATPTSSLTNVAGSSPASEETGFCINCGAGLSLSARFCSECGTGIVTA